MTAVRFLGVPTDLYRRLSEHLDEVARELALLDPQTSSAELSVRLIELAPLMDDGHRAVVQPLREQMIAARERGEERTDATVELSELDVGTLRLLHELLGAADAAARSGELLALPLEPEAVRLRAWIVDEAERQVTTEAEPRPWDG
jgi:hypothetical protein